MPSEPPNLEGKVTALKRMFLHHGSKLFEIQTPPGKYGLASNKAACCFYDQQLGVKLRTRSSSAQVCLLHGPPVCLRRGGAVVIDEINDQQLEGTPHTRGNEMLFLERKGNVSTFRNFSLHSNSNLVGSCNSLLCKILQQSGHGPRDHFCASLLNGRQSQACR